MDAQFTPKYRAIKILCWSHRGADKLKEMDDVVWEHATLQLNLSSMVEPIMSEVRCRQLHSIGLGLFDRLK